MAIKSLRSVQVGCRTQQHSDGGARGSYAGRRAYGCLGWMLNRQCLIACSLQIANRLRQLIRVFLGQASEWSGSSRTCETFFTTFHQPLQPFTNVLFPGKHIIFGVRNSWHRGQLIAGSISVVRAHGIRRFQFWQSRSYFAAGSSCPYCVRQAPFFPQPMHLKLYMP